jgi:hypothetical protein
LDLNYLLVVLEVDLQVVYFLLHQNLLMMFHQLHLQNLLILQIETPLVAPPPAPPPARSNC